MTTQTRRGGLRQDAVVAPALAAAARIVEVLGAGAMLVSDPAALRWLGVTLPSGSHVLVSSGSTLVVAPVDLEQLSGSSTESYSTSDPRGLASALGRGFSRVGLRSGDRLAIEPHALPFAAAEALQDRPWVDCAGELAAARMRKTADELVLLAASVKLADAGHDAVRATAHAGVNELEMWASAQRAMQAVHGAPVEAIVDLMTGVRTDLVGAPPTSAALADGVPVIFDLAPCANGYWVDSCATISSAGASHALSSRHAAVSAALETGVVTARVGVRACQLDAAIRSRLDLYGLHCPHHTGHGVGTAPQEEPWITPDSSCVLEEGIVLALEPGAYGDGIGVRLEQLVVIEPAGARVLSGHSLSLVD